MVQNSSSKDTGKHPVEILKGILIPIPKQKPPGHLRSIILLFIIRKILAICIIRIIAQKIHQKIPISQATYQ